MNPLLIGSIGIGLLTQVRLNTVEREQQTARARALSAPPSSPARIGFTAPTDIYEAMRQIQSSAEALDADVAANVIDPAFRAAWAAWFHEWRAFFDANYRKLGTILHTDELKAQVESYRSQLLSWYDGYTHQSAPNGAPLPAPHGVPPLRPPPEAETSGGGSLLPWWAWMLGGVAVVGAGYLAYRHYGEVQAKKRAIEREVLPGLIGAPLARAAAARDADLPFGSGMIVRDLPRASIERLDGPPWFVR